MNTTLFPQLQAFLAVARSHSFTAAARDLGVSRSAVSQSVRQLEKELRVTLVTRTTRSVSLTDAGKRLVDSAGPAVAQVRAALTEVTAKPGEVVGSLRLTVPRAGFEFVINPSCPGSVSGIPASSSSSSSRTDASTSSARASTRGSA